MSKAIRRRVSDAPPWVAEDMVAEILSWLPVESLQRFKCVCKKWYQLIQQHDFVEKHHRRAAMCFYYHPKYINRPTVNERPRQICTDAVFTCIDIHKGLLLEHEHRKDLRERLRIRNPATRQTAYLPDLRVGDDSPAWVVARMFFVAKSINECTVISFSESEESVLLGQFRAITVGVDAAWRPLKNSPPNSIHCISNTGLRPKIYALSIENIFYVITDLDKKILWVDAENESIKTAKIPENLFSFSDWRYVRPREWNSKLSLFYDRGYLIDVCVLMNNSKNEWAKCQTVDVATFTLNYPIPFITEEKEIWVREFDRKRWRIPWVFKEELSVKPTVLQLKGMQSDKVGEAIRIWKGRDMRKNTSQITSRVSDASPSSVPEDMVAEILSRLPVESLLRFKCVCKKWRQLIQQHDFVEKHHRHAAMYFYYHQKYKNQPTPHHRKDPEFTCIDIQKGLVLEHEYDGGRKDPTERLRIWNPATRQTVYLPDLRVGDDSPTWMVAGMFFVAKKDESIKTAKIPQNLFSDWRYVIPREWNSKLSLFCREGDQINIRVLVNKNKNEWAKTQTVDIKTFTHDYPIPFFTEEEKLWARGINGKRDEVIRIPIVSLYIPWRMKDELSIKPTVLQLKGMKSDKVDEAIGASFWKGRDMPTTTSQIISAIILLLNDVIG
nr:putative F-box protein At3g52320 [Ipomoea batatas]